MTAAAVTGALPWAHDEPTVDDVLALLRRPTWQADGSCREHPEVTWFPTRGQSTEPARRICLTCIVRPECAEWAAGQGVELQGVWGGLSREERLAGITTPRPVADPPPPRCRRCRTVVDVVVEGLARPLCAACLEHVARQREADRALLYGDAEGQAGGDPEPQPDGRVKDLADPAVGVSPRTGPAPVRKGLCVKCGQRTAGSRVHFIAGHALHASTCYHQVRRRAIKLGTTIEAVVKHLSVTAGAA